MVRCAREETHSLGHKWFPVIINDGKFSQSLWASGLWCPLNWKIGSRYSQVAWHFNQASKISHTNLAFLPISVNSAFLTSGIINMPLCITDPLTKQMDAFINLFSHSLVPQILAEWPLCPVTFVGKVDTAMKEKTRFLILIEFLVE